MKTSRYFATTLICVTHTAFIFADSAAQNSEPPAPTPVPILPVADTHTSYTAPLEIVAELPLSTPPGNIAVVPSGRIFLSMHQFHGSEYRAMELLPDGTTVPFPTEEWARAPKAGSPIGLNRVLGIEATTDGTVWILDNPADAQGAGKLVGWSVRNSQLLRVHYLPRPVIAKEAFLNDLAIDEKRQRIYITDTASGPDAALIVVDSQTGVQRRVLEGHASMLPEDLDMVIDERTITLGGKPARIGVNPITISPDFEWVYFGPMTGTSLYRIKAEVLSDFSAEASTLATAVEKFASKPICDGITIDTAGYLYISSITDQTIGIITPKGEYAPLYQDPLLSWADGFAIGPNNSVYATVNQLHRSAVLNGGTSAVQGNLLVVKFPTVGSVEGAPDTLSTKSKARRSNRQVDRPGQAPGAADRRTMPVPDDDAEGAERPRRPPFPGARPERPQGEEAPGRPLRPARPLQP